jgi:hypothetical protein
VKEDAGTTIEERDSADTIADLQSRLRDVQEELVRTSMQRDYILRLLRQQQTIGTNYVQNRVVGLYLQRDTILARMARGAPQRIKNSIPMPIKQTLKNIIVKIGYRSEF